MPPNAAARNATITMALPATCSTLIRPNDRTTTAAAIPARSHESFGAS
ncbi:hypothetical protein [Microbacterium jejuense]|nr:hypothetical protein [Microbacterium jejuense]